MKTALLCLFVSLIISCGGCSSVAPVSVTNPDLLKDKAARASMAFTIDNVAYVGTATVDRKPLHNFVFTLPPDTIKLMITSCAREDIFIEPNWKRPFPYEYRPVPNLEDSESCFLTATAITVKGVTHVGFTDFRGLEGLSANIACNGRLTFTRGVLFCQSREGLTQLISFKEPVAHAGQALCPDLKPGLQENAFELQIGKNFCAYKFMNKSKDIFRLTTFGYSMVNEVILGAQK